MAVAGISRTARTNKTSRQPAISRTRFASLPLILFLLLALLSLLILLSLGIGSRLIAPADTLHGLLNPGASTEATIIWKLRMPRTLAAVLVGAALASAGVLMQSLTRNPLAEPGLVGVNSGAAVAVVSAVAVFGVTSTGGQVWFALAGAALAACLAFLLGSTRSRTQDAVTRLILAGVALNACLGSVTGIITMFNSKAFDSYRFWVVGSVAERTYGSVAAVAPLILLGLVLGLLLIRPLSACALGDDCAVALGVPLPLVRGATLLAITLLCGGSVALAGPIGFVGLVVPHVLRLLVGNRLSLLLPLSIVAGPILVLAADIIGRVIALPSEIEVGIVTAFIGAPVLLWLVMRMNAEPKKPRFRRAQNAGCGAENCCAASCTTLHQIQRGSLDLASQKEG